MANRFLALVAPVLAVAAVATASPALAQANNNPPPAGAIYSLAGQAQSLEYVNYNFSFQASSATTNLTFALRNDPVFIQLDNVSVSTNGGANLIVNGGFEAGPIGGSAPNGWTYVNQYGAIAGGVTRAGCGIGGGNCYYDGAVQAYDAITQVLATTIGTTYDVSFWASVNSIRGTGFYQALSDNGVAGTGGNGINLAVYAQDGIPLPGGVPEPATWALMIMGFGMTGGVLRRRRATMNGLVTA